MSTKLDPKIMFAAALALSLSSATPASARPFFFKKAPLQLQARSYSVPKAGEEASKNQDAHASDVVSGRFAVADGVSRSAHPREWAQVLADAFVAEGPIDGKLVEWMRPLRTQWKSRVDQKLDQKKTAVAAARVAATTTPVTPAARVSLFEDFASDRPVTAPPAIHATAGDELMGELMKSPGQVRKVEVSAKAIGATDVSAGDDLVAWIGKQKTEEKGASATLLGLEIRPGADGKATWRSTALRDANGKFSDSVVFQVRKRSGVIGWLAASVLRKGKLKTLDHWPPLEEADFSTTPAQLRTKADADSATHLAVKEGAAKRGDQLVLTTDAIGKWIMSAKGRERSVRLQKLLDSKSQGDFARLIDTERDQGMGNDDSTVTVIDLR